MIRLFAFLAAALGAAAAVWIAYGEVFVSFATIALNYGKVWLVALLKKFGWHGVWRFLQPLFVRLAAWELPKRFSVWALTLTVGARNRRVIQHRLETLKQRLHAWRRARYTGLEARFGRHTRVVVGGALVVVSVLLSVFVLSFYALWYSASFFRALLALGGWVVRYAFSWVKIGAFNSIVLSPLRWLQKVLPARHAAALRRFNIRIAREIIRRTRTTLPQLDRREFSLRQLFLMFWLPIWWGVLKLTGRIPAAARRYAVPKRPWRIRPAEVRRADS